MKRFFPNNCSYKPYRAYRGSKTKDEVIIAVNEDYLSSQVEEVETDCDMICVSLVHANQLLISDYYTLHEDEHPRMKDINKSMNHTYRKTQTTPGSLVIIMFPTWTDQTT